MMNLSKRLPTWGVYTLLAYMPFHIFFAQSLSLLTGGLNVWKVAKDVLLAALTLVTIFLVWQNKRSNKPFTILVSVTAVYGLIHVLVWALNPHIFSDTALLGTVYNVRLLCFAVLGSGAVLLWPKAFLETKLIKYVLVVSTVVCALGILQYFLPKDILTHVGYSLARGVKPAFFIDDKPDLPRIMSTLRDPNSLGAFLILPICLLVQKLQKSKQKMLVCGLLGLHGLVLFLTFSRGAWVGSIIAVLSVYLLYRYKAKLTQHKRPMLAVMITLLIIGVFGYTFRNQYVVQNIVLHSDKSTTASQDSNELHVSLAENGLRGIVHKPLGHGPGTAGIVSIHNPNGGTLTENYYIQIGYEVGILGLIMFVTTSIIIYLKLQKRRTSLSICLMASFIAYGVMGLVMHIWANEAVAAQWWLLAGAVISARDPAAKKL